MGWLERGRLAAVAFGNALLGKYEQKPPAERLPASPVSGHTPTHTHSTSGASTYAGESRPTPTASPTSGAVLAKPMIRDISLQAAAMRICARIPDLDLIDVAEALKICKPGVAEWLVFESFQKGVEGQVDRDELLKATVIGKVGLNQLRTTICPIFFIAATAENVEQAIATLARRIDRSEGFRLLPNGLTNKLIYIFPKLMPESGVVAGNGFVNYKAAESKIQANEVLKFVKVSRRHLRLTFDPHSEGHFQVEDLGSTNGTVLAHLDNHVIIEKGSVAVAAFGSQVILGKTLPLIVEGPLSSIE